MLVKIFYSYEDVSFMFIEAPSGKYWAIGKSGLKGFFSIFVYPAYFMENWVKDVELSSVSYPSTQKSQNLIAIHYCALITQDLNRQPPSK